MNTFTSSKVETFSSAAEASPYKAHKAVIDIVSSLSSYIHIYWPIKPFSGLAIKFFYCVYDNNGISDLSTLHTDNEPSIYSGGLRRTLDVLPQEQVHPGGHHQQRQRVSKS